MESLAVTLTIGPTNGIGLALIGGSDSEVQGTFPWGKGVAGVLVGTIALVHPLWRGSLSHLVRTRCAREAGRGVGAVMACLKVT
jgi:hypothetical protein